MVTGSLEIAYDEGGYPLLPRVPKIVILTQFRVKKNLTCPV